MVIHYHHNHLRDENQLLCVVYSFKMKLKPSDRQTPTCFGMTWKAFFSFFVFINMGQNIIGISLVIHDITTTLVALPKVEVFPLDEQIKFYLRVVAWIWYGVHMIISIFMDIRLFRTATLPNTFFLSFYAIFHSVSLSIYATLHYALYIIGSLVLPRTLILTNMLLPGYLLYRFYTSYVVYRYSLDIDFDIKMKSGYRNLTDDEIELFENGMLFADEQMKEKYCDSCYEMAQLLAYQRKEFEIAKKDLDFSESSPLGCGEYGCVYKIYWNTDNNSRIAVAAKTVDPELADVNQFKALLTEAKVMMSMGRHENVVGLLGVCTEDIRERKLFIVCDLCEFGNLRTYLRSERNTFLNLFARKNDNAEGHVSIDVEDSAMTTIDLVRWAFEIAAGMEFLGEKKIIHGDLAARNVLVTASRTTKITDFGLSRRLYNYSVYKKRHNVPLPWRWLAIESLVDMDFSVKSDVWSYGVCCWEIFELGARPWPEFQLFTSEFIDALNDGKVPKKGELRTAEIYDTIRLCWERNPNDRPSFSVLKEYFSSVLTEIQPKKKTRQQHT